MQFKQYHEHGLKDLKEATTKKRWWISLSHIIIGLVFTCNWNCIFLLFLAVFVTVSKAHKKEKWATYFRRRDKMLTHFACTEREVPSMLNKSRNNWIKRFLSSSDNVYFESKYLHTQKWITNKKQMETRSLPSQSFHIESNSTIKITSFNWPGQSMEDFLKQLSSLCFKVGSIGRRKEFNGHGCVSKGKRKCLNDLLRHTRVRMPCHNVRGRIPSFLIRDHHTN